MARIVMNKYTKMAQNPYLARILDLSGSDWTRTNDTPGMNRML